MGAHTHIIASSHHRHTGTVHETLTVTQDTATLLHCYTATLLHCYTGIHWYTLEIHWKYIVSSLLVAC